MDKTFTVFLLILCAQQGWSSLTPWTACSRTCGGGTQSRRRNYNNGISGIFSRIAQALRQVETHVCGTQPCPNGTGINGTGVNGNINNVNTTGASSATAEQDKLGYSGVSASRAMAERDLPAINQHKSKIIKAANRLGVDPALIAGIMSRETRGGKVLGSDGFGADGFGYGLMQVDKRSHTLKGEPYSLDHILQGTQILIDMVNGVADEHPDWDEDMTLKGGIAAYNFGVSNVQTYENLDNGTTGNDYSNDVIARAQYFKANGY